jgi:hypothetical protein
MFLDGQLLYTVSASTGALSARAWNDGVPSSASSVVSGPSIDGIDWRGRALFVGPPVGPLPPDVTTTVPTTGPEPASIDVAASAVEPAARLDVP